MKLRPSQIQAHPTCPRTRREQFQADTKAQPVPQKMKSQIDIPEQTEVVSVDTTEMQMRRLVSPQVAPWKRELKILKRKL